MKSTISIGIVLLVLLPELALSKWHLGDLYSDDVLQHWQSKYSDNIRWNFENLVIGKLTPQERSRVGKVRLNLPLRAPGEFRDHPLLFYAAKQTITAPIFSIRFFDDITQAWAYLWSNGHRLDLVSDYIAMLKYKDPADFPGQRFPPPLEALGISRDAWRHDSRMDDVSQKALKSAIVWILAHELGHIYYQHPGYGNGVTLKQAQENESQADRFANMIMRRIGVAPVGMVQFFMIMANLDSGRGDFANDAAWKRYLETKATHPLTALRLKRIAIDLRRAPYEFTSEEANQREAVNRIHYIANQIEGIGEILEDPGMHRLTVAIGLATDLQSLQKRRRALNPVTAKSICERNTNGPLFSGKYSGLYSRNLRNGQVEWLSANLNLQRHLNRVQGRFTFGVGEGKLQGTVAQGNRLVFDWQWGNASGKGMFEVSPSGELVGKWGYDLADKGGGDWDLCVSNQ